MTEDTRAPSESEPASDDGSVDSFLRAVAHAPAKSPAAPRLDRDATARGAGDIVAGRFRLEKPLGEGGMGVVWRAVHVVTRKPLALKFLKRAADDPRALQRFLREARAACAVRHASVVEVHDVLELEDGSPVMVMELLTGETLAERLARTGAMPLSELAPIVVHVCSAVGAAHALGIVHRDLKPENIFLAATPKGRSVKVLDFGIAKLTASEGDAAHTGAMTGTGALLGTPYYMAPEQLYGERDVDGRADVWSLGIILHEALLGERPTQAANLGQVFKLVTTGSIVPLRTRSRGVPADVLDLVERMLSVERSRRPSSMHEVVRVLSKYSDESYVPLAPPADLAVEVAPVPESAPPRPPKAVATPDGSVSATRASPAWSRAPARSARSRLAAMGVAVVLVTIGVTAWQVRGTDAERLTANDWAFEVVAPPLVTTPNAPIATAPPAADPPPPPTPSARAKRLVATVAAPSARATASAPRPPVDPGSYQ